MKLSMLESQTIYDVGILIYPYIHGSFVTAARVSHGFLETILTHCHFL
jgi:hypothetical protein